MFSAEGETSYYVPAGVWTHLQTGGRSPGRAGCARRCRFDQVPVLVRPGTVLAMGAVHERPDYPYADGVTLALYQFPDGVTTTVSVPSPDGSEAARFTVARAGQTVTVTRVAGEPLPWNVLPVSPGATPVALAAAEDRCVLTL